MSGCWQALCLTGRGLDTCWRPGSIATNVYVANAVLIQGMLVAHVPFTPVRRITE